LLLKQTEQCRLPGMKQVSPTADPLHFSSYYRWLVINRELKFKADSHSLLDIGCDNGEFLRSQRSRIRVGVDLEPHVSSGNGLAIVQADANQLPFRQGQFMTVTAFDIIEHIPDDDRFLESALDMLAPGGTLFLSTPADETYIFPRFLNERAMKGWNHQRIGYIPEVLTGMIPADYEVSLVRWNSWAFRHLYLLTKLTSFASKPLSRGLMRMCFELDRRLRPARGHIYLLATRPAA